MPQFNLNYFTRAKSAKCNSGPGLTSIKEIHHNRHIWNLWKLTKHTTIIKIFDFRWKTVQKATCSSKTTFLRTKFQVSELNFHGVVFIIKGHKKIKYVHLWCDAIRYLFWSYWVVLIEFVCLTSAAIVWMRWTRRWGWSLHWSSTEWTHLPLVQTCML